MILRADGIIFRQLLVKLDGMIGDDVADERMSGLRRLARMLAEQMDDLVRDALPEMIKMTKVQASQKMADSLERIVKIFEAIKMFREESMLDVVADAMGSWRASEAASRPSTSAGGGVGVGTPSSLALGLRNPSLRSATGSRPRSGTQSSLSSLAGPLANFHLRRRDNSVSSTLSEPQSTWTSEFLQQPSSSASASESELSPSVDQSQIPNTFYAPLARKATRSDSTSSTTFGSLALAMPQLHTSPQTLPESMLS